MAMLLLTRSEKNSIWWRPREGTLWRWPGNCRAPNWGGLRGANLRGAYLYKAELLWAKLSKADLSGAHLVGALLSAADPEAHLSRRTCNARVS
jgi:Pentapeptide repeats (8 copies)